MDTFQEICCNPHPWLRYTRQQNLSRGVFGLEEVWVTTTWQEKGRGGLRAQPWVVAGPSALICQGLVEVSPSLRLKEVVPCAQTKCGLPVHFPIILGTHTK